MIGTLLAAAGGAIVGSALSGGGGSSSRHTTVYQDSGAGLLAEEMRRKRIGELYDKLHSMPEVREPVLPEGVSHRDSVASLRRVLKNAGGHFDKLSLSQFNEALIVTCHPRCSSWEVSIQIGLLPGYSAPYIHRFARDGLTLYTEVTHAKVKCAGKEFECGAPQHLVDSFMRVVEKREQGDFARMYVEDMIDAREERLGPFLRFLDECRVKWKKDWEEHVDSLPDVKILRYIKLLEERCIDNGEVKSWSDMASDKKRVLRDIERVRQ